MQLFEDWILHPQALQIRFLTLVEFHKIFQASYWASSLYQFEEKVSLDHQSKTCNFPQKCTTCTAVNLVNFPWSTWVSVNCHQKIGSTIACQHKSTESKLSNMSSLPGGNKTCPRNTVLNNNTCFNFEWMPSTSLFNKHKNKYQEMNAFFQFSSLAHLFSAISARAFPPLFSFDFAKLVVPKRYFFLLRFEYDFVFVEQVSAYYLSTVNYIRWSSGRDVNIFHCSDSSTISTLSQCDGVLDCHGNDTSDESTCEFQKMMPTTRPRECADLFYSSHNGLCHMYIFHEMKSIVTSPENFTCFNGSIVDILLTNDLVVDCYPKGEDELALKYLLQGNQYFYCNKPGQIPCREGHFVCFDIHDICTYKLNKALKLYPCRTGEHLQDCKQVECNMMFKCQGYYCVPYKYMCNGRWDCPNGEDELTEQMCQQERSCQYFFQCKNTKICIHLGNICDSQDDCPLGDDEFLCSLALIPCPNDCQCLAFAARCSNVSTYEKFEKQIFAFFVISLEFVALHLEIQPSVQNLSQISLKNVVLDSLFGSFQKARKAVSLEVTHCTINKLGSTCCSGFHLLKSLVLTFDKIKNLYKRTFCNLPSLKLIDLSGNMLTELTSPSFKNISGRIFVLHNNSFALQKIGCLNIDGIQVLKTDVYHLCCVLQSNMACSSSMPWFVVCSGLLINTSLRISFCTIALTVCTLNICSALLQQCSQKRNQQTQSRFYQVAIAINISDAILSILFIVIWRVDIHLHIDFMLKELVWRSSPLCFSLFGLFTLLSFLSPLLLCFFSLSRFLAVKYPLITKLQHNNHVKSIILWIVLSATIWCCFIVSLPFMLQGQQFPSGIPNSLCFPFIDPIRNTAITELLTWCVSMIHIASLVFIVICDVLLYLALTESQVAVKSASSKRNTTKPLVLQLFILVVINICSWIPSSTVFLTALYVKQYPPEMVAWTTISAGTINSLFNPIVLIVTTVKKLCC